MIRPAVVDHDVTQDAYAAGLDIHLDLDGRGILRRR